MDEQKRGRRIGLYLLLNVVVSALTVVLVLFIWDRVKGPVSGQLPTAPATTQDQETTAPAVTPLPAGTATPVLFTEPAKLEISAVVGVGDLASERVVILHTGGGTLSLEGWTLRDEDGHVFIFPAFTLYEGGAVTVYTRTGANNIPELFWGLVEAIWSSGEKATLLDPSSLVQAEYIIP